MDRRLFLTSLLTISFPVLGALPAAAAPKMIGDFAGSTTIDDEETSMLLNIRRQDRSGKFRGLAYVFGRSLEIVGKVGTDRTITFRGKSGRVIFSFEGKIKKRNRITGDCKAVRGEKELFAGTFALGRLTS